MKHALALVLLLAACKPAMIHVDDITCPVDVPPEIIAAFLGCKYDVKTTKTTCPPPIASVIPQLTLDACDMVTPDGGACNE
jgi:hypothetical protein